LAFKATEITNEMTEVLSLRQDEKAKGYSIQLKRFQELVTIREQYKYDDQTRKLELKKVLSKDKILQWRNYKREIGRD
tara:strand:+ start:445 stop:678 length:234 start_codon:yes stop_codon:yes gene_type:complete